MSLLLAFILMSAFASTPAGAKDLNLAKQAEEKAFAAADQGLWCDATLHFLQAHQEAPNAQYIYNAAMAADSAGDRRWALHLFVLILGTYPDDERTQTISERTQIISQEIAKEGAGSPCATRVADSTPQNQKDAFWIETTPSPPAPATAPAPTPMVFGDNNIRWTVVATGGTLALGGATMTVFGAYPYIEGLELYQRVLDDNSSQNRQAYTLVRERWQTLGRPVAIAGAAAFTVGSIVTAFGLKWALEKPEATE